MLAYFLISLFLLTPIQSAHFRGGTIYWTPVDPTTTSSTVVVTVIQTYLWRLSAVPCVYTGFATSGYIPCVTDCSTSGNYTSTTLSAQTTCISSSPSIDAMTGQGIRNIALDAESHFTIAYQGNAWISLVNSYSLGGGKWSISTVIDLRRRADGIFNTPPMSYVQSPQFVVLNKTKSISIPVFDINTGDDVRCRWAQYSR